MAFCIRDCRALPQLAAEVWLQCGLHCGLHTARQSDTAATVVAPPINFRCTLRMRMWTTLDFRTGANTLWIINCHARLAVACVATASCHPHELASWPAGAPGISRRGISRACCFSTAHILLHTWLTAFQALLNSSQSSSATIRQLQVHCKALLCVGIDISADLLSRVPGSRIECNASSMRIVLQDPSQSCDQQQNNLRATVLSCSGAAQASCMHHRYARLLKPS